MSIRDHRLEDSYNLYENFIQDQELLQKKVHLNGDKSKVIQVERTTIPKAATNTTSVVSMNEPCYTHKSRKNSSRKQNKWEWKGLTNELKQALAAKRADLKFEENPGFCQDINWSNLKISQDKEFMLDPKFGWNWHKSWRLPSIVLKYDDGKDIEFNIPGLKVELLCVKLTNDSSSHISLKQIKLRGTIMKSFTKELTYFSGIHFTSTSHKNEGNKFHLMLLIYLQNRKDKNKLSHVMFSTYSPAIYVDARKASRYNLANRRKSFLINYLEPFNPKILDMHFYKRFKTGGRKKCENIINTSKGLYDYFTALNIKHKVKHPLFMALKFDYSIKVYYNTNMKIDEGKSSIEENVAVRIQKILFSYCSNITSKQQHDMILGDDKNHLEKTEIIFLILETYDSKVYSVAKAISELFMPVQSIKMQFIFDSTLLTENFKEVSLANLRTQYISLYPEFIEMGKNDPQFMKLTQESKDMNDELGINDHIHVSDIVGEGHDNNSDDDDGNDSNEDGNTNNKHNNNNNDNEVSIHIETDDIMSTNNHNNTHEKDKAYENSSETTIEENKKSLQVIEDKVIDHTNTDITPRMNNLPLMVNYKQQQHQKQQQQQQQQLQQQQKQQQKMIIEHRIPVTVNTEKILPNDYSMIRNCANSSCFNNPNILNMSSILNPSLPLYDLSSICQPSLRYPSLPNMLAPTSVAAYGYNMNPFVNYNPNPLIGNNNAWEHLLKLNQMLENAELQRQINYLNSFRMNNLSFRN